MKFNVYLPTLHSFKHDVVSESLLAWWSVKCGLLIDCLMLFYELTFLQQQICTVCDQETTW